MSDKELSVLILDDEEMICKLFKGYLEDFGFSVKTAETGADGLQLVSENSFDAAIVDMRLPDMVGNDFILKSHDINPKMKYFVHTGSLDYKIPEELLEIGVSEDSILHKPIADINEVYEKILEVTVNS